MKKSILLIISVVLSAFSIVSYEIFPDDDYQKSYDSLKLIGPGVFYSLFLISFLHSTLKRIIFNYLLFLVTWITLFWLTYASWGVITPISGAVSGVLIGRIIFGLDETYSLKRDPYLWTGGFSALVGLFLFYLSNSDKSNVWGFSLMWIIICWQLAIGILVIKNSRKQKL